VDERAQVNREQPPSGPPPHGRHPIPAFPQIAFLKNVITSPLIEVGDYTYFDDPEGPEHFERRNVLYHFDFIGDRLVIGKFCSIARGVRFLMNGGNHSLAGFSAYPFCIFGHGWEGQVSPDEKCTSKGDTVVGNDVWLGYGATILPGATIGDGAVVGACLLVSSNVAPDTIVAGNPAGPIRRRFDEPTIDRLLALRWWDWPIERITARLEAIVRGDMGELERESL
jgi:virginiamycin A acetyltransferase